jgi:hypothetical protein
LSDKNKQNITYKPQIKYTADYHTKGKAVSQSGVTVKKENNRLPLDTDSIPQIGDNIEYLNSALKALPKALQNALREIYDPVKDIYYDTLLDKIVDPNLNPEKIEIKVPDPDPEPPPTWSAILPDCRRRQSNLCRSIPARFSHNPVNASPGEPCR